MSQVKEAVFELMSAIHNWREKQGPEQLNRVVLAANVLEGYSLDLEKSLELAAELSPIERCICGGIRLPYPVQSFNVPITACAKCSGIFATVQLNSGPEA
jgi:hypothetical protein